MVGEGGPDSSPPGSSGGVTPGRSRPFFVILHQILNRRSSRRLDFGAEEKPSGTKTFCEDEH